MVEDGLPLQPGEGRPSADVPHTGSGGGRRSTLPASVVQVLALDGGVAGAGFLVGEATAVTCAHVVCAAGQHPGGQVDLAFPRLPGAPRTLGTVLAGQWRAPEAEDVAVLRLERVPPGAGALAVG
ncbi:hypothetical protein CCS38_09305, partial [Streptomyces purpurogeneiscleroticus]|nr:hypothetical protein [Streptomyces purpurogeneiscleroticus]